jgi:hypothetical protein
MKAIALRNREGQWYRAIQEFIPQNESQCMLLSAAMDVTGTQLALVIGEVRLAVSDDPRVESLCTIRKRLQHSPSGQRVAVLILEPVGRPRMPNLLGCHPYAVFPRRLHARRGCVQGK